MLIKCENCGHSQEISPAAILGKEGGKKSKRTITPEQQAKMQQSRKAKAIAKALKVKLEELA